MNASKIILPPLASHIYDEPSGRVKLPGLLHVMNENSTEHTYAPKPITPSPSTTNLRSISLPSNIHIPTLSSQSGLYSPVSNELSSPVSRVNPVRLASQPQLPVFPEHSKEPYPSYPKQPSTPVYMPPSPVYQMPSPPLSQHHYQHQQPQHQPHQYYQSQLEQQQQQHQPQNQQYHIQHQQQIPQVSLPVLYQLQTSGAPQGTTTTSLSAAAAAAIKSLPKQASAWSPEDDKLLRYLKEDRKLGWRDVATYFPRRTPNACQFRWRRIVSASKSCASSTITKKNPYISGKFDSKKSSVSYLLNAK